MAAPAVLTLLLLLLLHLCLVVGQIDTLGFISIDCGIPEGTSYSDPSTNGLRYVSGAGFTDAGINAGINPPYNDEGLARRYLTVRYFPDDGGGAARSCYTLGSLFPGGRYLVRATFYYGNYDALTKPPTFDLHLGVNRWVTVNITAAGDVYIFEAVVMSWADFFQVCLVNRSLGTPFISGLDLRPLQADMYPEVTLDQSLALLNFRRPTATYSFNRYHFSRPATSTSGRFYGNTDAWTNITTSIAINVSNTSNIPLKILQNAATPVNGTRIDFTWSSDSSINDGNGSYLLMLYFMEVQRLPSNALRRFDILVDDSTWIGSQRYAPKYLSADLVKRKVLGSSQHTVSLVATSDATLPPILNAFEMYSELPMTELATDDADAKAMMTICTKYALKKNWMGDPCAPKAFAWDGLNCNYSSPGPASIRALDLSSSGLSGAIDTSFGDLKSLQHMNLSNNNLTGPVPDFLAQMPSLTFLDLSSNKLSGLVPAVLLQKRQNGSLVLRTGNNANLCDNAASACKTGNKNRSIILVIAIVAPVAVATLIIVAVVLILRRRKHKQVSWRTNNSRFPMPRERPDVFENRQFTYKELKLMTANFKEEIGRGGFGAVFLGYLEDGSPVAVKMCSKTSRGDQEFSAEVQHLTRVHHRNLVSLIGYCKDKKHQAIVYEYMHGGNLEGRLRGEASAATSLTWHQRLKIALDSAHGLEYLHKACQPPLIHRDVKTTNILLSADLEAKISDFGLTKVFADDFISHITTQPADLPISPLPQFPAVDPEYYNTSHLSEKSDVYSFGVVLLELITGQPPAIPVTGTESIHIALWVRQNLSMGNIESIVDPRMRGEYDVNSVWKVAEMALRCKEQPSQQRPTMTDIVAELKESVELDALHAMGYYSSVPSSTVNLSATSVDFQSDAQANNARQETMLELELEHRSATQEVAR
ncbi:hypothetical protein U9M48_037106 [Paspalum notatum var. saurae]|uniref:non-specific serine/threonine protein kinase n=1 Tax=Paspalum notatum var. saurae TaxID=547442 RepID=A0AAQ3UIL2_PASNO